MKMMIMAQQHPQREPPPPSNYSAQQDQLITNNQNQSQRQPTAAPFNEAFHVPKCKMIVTSENQPPINKQQQQQSQDDNKRSLIKNQLYLIEQLQLENADLRNERDQLQLENEELKFQLQMISSSNILSQPGGTFNNHQTLVGSGESGPKASPLDNGNTSVVNSLSVRKTMPTTDGGVIVGGIDETANKSTSKPLFGTSPRKMGVEQDFHHQQVQLQGNNFLVRSSSRSPAILDQESVSEISPTGAGVSHTQITTIRIPQQSTAPSITVNNKSLGFKSTSLTAINVNSVTASLAKRARKNDNDDDDDDNDEDEQRRKFVEQIYGDSEKIQAAVIVIQRAFRKRQICKRFRAITEQLRQARQPNGNQLQQSERKSEPSSPNASTRGRSVAEGFTFASGTTRAAAWESLSYAASRLAAAAASATSAKQNEDEVPPSSRSNQRTISQQQKVSRNHQQQHQHQHQPLTDSRVPLKTANPVVAAAINFQQLESIRKRQYRVGLNIFNKSPEKGVSFLIAHSFIDASPPFAKNSSSYYHSNQLHFIDKQHVLHERTVASLQDNTTINPQLSQCQLCTEEENLKRNIAYFLLHRKGLAKEKIGQYLGNLQENFNQDVLKYYLQELDFNGLQVDLALRKFLSTFRLPGEAQKIERIVDCFAQRYVQCQQVQLAPMSTVINVSPMIPQQPIKQQSIALTITNQTCQQQAATTIQQQNTPQYKNNLMLLSKDEIFILTFAIIMLNTDLHSPSLKPTSRMSPQQFVNNLRGVFKSHNINESDLIEIYDRVKSNQITTTPDHVSHVMKVQQGLTVNNFQKKELPNLCVPHRRLVCFCRLFEVYDVSKKERPGQHQREIFLFNDLLLVTKLARRVRANPTQTYTNRQSIPLQGLYVQLFQSQHYLFGIRLCRKSDDETLIMFNARNELDQSRFVDDLSESIAEMDEMETIKAHNLVETIHFRQQERLRRHRMSHAISENAEDNKVRPNKATTNMIERCDTTKESKNSTVVISSQRKISDNLTPSATTRKESDKISIPASRQQGRGLISKFSSMMNLSSNEVDENQTQPKGLRLNHSFVQQQQPTNQLQEPLPPTANNQPGSHNDSGTSSGQRRSSTGSVHSLDSGLFLSRDISPNQSS